MFPLILYKLRLLKFDSFMHRIVRNLGITIDTVLLSYAFGPIDVDNPKTFEFSERTLNKRRV